MFVNLPLRLGTDCFGLVVSYLGFIDATETGVITQSFDGLIGIAKRVISDSNNIYVDLREDYLQQWVGEHQNRHAKIFHANEVAALSTMMVVNIHRQSWISGKRKGHDFLACSAGTLAGTQPEIWLYNQHFRNLTHIAADRLDLTVVSERGGSFWLIFFKCTQFGYAVGYTDPVVIPLEGNPTTLATTSTHICLTLNQRLLLLDKTELEPMSCPLRLDGPHSVAMIDDIYVLQKRRIDVYSIKLEMKGSIHTSVQYHQLVTCNNQLCGFVRFSSSPLRLISIR